MDENELAKIVVDLGFKIYKNLVQVYLNAFMRNAFFTTLKKIGLKVEKQKSLSIIYDDLVIENAFKIDFNI